MKEPREFFVPPWEIVEVEFAKKKGDKRLIHAIEYSAYDELKAENERLKEIINEQVKVISAMDGILIDKGVNFDFSKLKGMHK